MTALWKLDMPDYAVLDEDHYLIRVEKAWQAFAICDSIPDKWSIAITDPADSLVIEKLRRALG